MDDLANHEQPVVIISADSHAGARMADYREYLDRRWHDDFDAWAEGFRNPWRFAGDPDGDNALPGRGVNWDSSSRLEHLDAQGVAAEVLYPNTIPPFFPSLALFGSVPSSAEDYERRWAGLQAHNRWMSEFCADAPPRRAGLAQLFVNDIDDAMCEVRWAREHGLRGVLIQAVPPNHPTVPALWSDHYDPLWAVCQDLEMPVHQHNGGGAPDMKDDDAAGRAVLGLEIAFFSHRTLWHLIVGGAFERFPNLRFVVTESGASWIPRTLATLDEMFDRYRENTSIGQFGMDAMSGLSLNGTEYFARNCYVASFLTPAETGMRDAIGTENMMWGTDFPHEESTYPFEREAERRAFSAVPTEDARRILGLNALALYDLPGRELGILAARIGPSPAAIRVPLDGSPGNTRSCPVFRERDALSVV